MLQVISSGITLTKTEALRIQAEQVAHYADLHGAWVREAVAAATTADALGEGPHDMVTVNRHIPRGEEMEGLIAAKLGEQASTAETTLSEPVRQLVRTWSPCGPCITEGVLIRRTAKFYIFHKIRAAEPVGGERRISCSKAHVEPCTRCEDHENTVYPNGYMD
jgi:hypothetical protein